MPFIPLRASGGKEIGSGKTVEQLFAFGPQIKGLPTILDMTKLSNRFTTSLSGELVNRTKTTRKMK